LILRLVTAPIGFLWASFVCILYTIEPTHMIFRYETR
jgi:hypothetical protein